MKRFVVALALLFACGSISYAGGGGHGGGGGGHGGGGGGFHGGHGGFHGGHGGFGFGGGGVYGPDYAAPYDDDPDQYSVSPCPGRSWRDARGVMHCGDGRPRY